MCIIPNSYPYEMMKWFERLTDGVTAESIMINNKKWFSGNWIVLPARQHHRRGASKRSAVGYAHGGGGGGDGGCDMSYLLCARELPKEEEIREVWFCICTRVACWETLPAMADNVLRKPARQLSASPANDTGASPNPGPMRKISAPVHRTTTETIRFGEPIDGLG